jgi:hypothetical protein
VVALRAEQTIGLAVIPLNVRRGARWCKVVNDKEDVFGGEGQSLECVAGR